MRAIAIAFLLSGCVAFKPVPESAICGDLCVGPYDLALPAHRRALGLN